MDIAENMLEVAREKARDQGIENVEFRHLPGASLDVGEEEFDAATCRFGMMFMPEVGSTAATVHRALKPGGRFAIATWGPPEANPFIGIPVQILSKYVEQNPPAPGSPGPFAFADPERLKQLFSNAGFRDVTIEPLEFIAAAFDSGHEYLRYILDVAGSAGNVFNQVPDGEKNKVAEEIAAAAGGGDSSGRVALRGTALITVGAK